MMEARCIWAHVGLVLGSLLVAVAGNYRQAAETGSKRAGDERLPHCLPAHLVAARYVCWRYNGQQPLPDSSY